MDYFDDLNPYIARQTDSSLPDSDITNQQSFLENILRLNIGKIGQFFFTFTGSTEWRDRSFTGIVEQVGRDHFVIKEVNSENRTLLLFVYMVWASFDEKMTYTLKRT